MALRLIANENVPVSVIQTLRFRGPDVLSVKERMRGHSDRSILSIAQSEERVVVTQDKDFGELAYRHGLSAACGVILFRLSGDSPEHDHDRMVTVIESRDNEWRGHFSVVSDERIRIRQLPANH